MKLLFAFLVIAAGITSCNQLQSGANQNVDSGSTLIPVEKDVTKCMPHDTADVATGAFVKYVKYDTTYGLIVGNGTWQTRWRDDIECSFPKAAIPKYEWSSEKVIALRNGCGGNNCSKHVYFIVGTNNFYRRENVFAFDRTNHLIAYFTDNYCMTIENVHTLQKMEYTFTEIPACPSYIACVGKGEFSKGRLTFDIRMVRDNRDQIETKSFSITDNLYKNQKKYNTAIMNRAQLKANIFSKKSVLCVGLDTDLTKIPAHLLKEEDPVFAFNKAIIDATKDQAVSYKINTAFYEAQGLKGWISMEKTLNYIPKDIFTIADAKRGDIGNTSEQYARTFFHTYPFDSVTVAPYMGSDSVQPFLKFEDKWAIVLGLTSNAGSADFQLQPSGDELMYQKVLKTVASWGTPENIMFVIGATRKEQLQEVRALLPHHFFLVPGVGTQGGDVDTVCRNTMNEDGGVLINVSRGIIYVANDESFADKAHDAAVQYQKEMSVFF